MRISNIVDILILVISLIGISSLYLTESVNLLFLIIFTFSTFPVFVSILTVKKYFVHSGTSSILAVITVGYLIFDIFFLNNEVVYALINFLVLIHAVKLISNKKIRDYQQIVLLSFLQILASSILTTKFIFGVFLLLYLVFGLLTLIVLNIKKEKLNANNSSDAKVDIYSLIKFEILIIVVVLVTTTSFFLILPRFNAGFLSGLFIKPNSIRSGFSEKVELGRVGVIKSDNSPVMRVKILNKDKPDIKGPIYWRGLALDEFDGKSWSVSRNNSKSIVKANRYGSIVVRNYDIANENEFLKQEIITEPIDTDILFAAEKPVSFSRMPNLKMVVTNNSYLMIGSRKNRVKYLSYSNINKPNKNLLRSEKWDIPSDIKFNYSKPKGLSSSFNDLVEELKDENSSYYENIINVRDYILRNYEYTRTLRSSDEVYPLDDFLFKYKEGHCEYFASSMVLILRSMGIPSRLVTGFVGGEFNPYGNFYLVRESNAHAWVEVYFSSYGWVLFDPTPESNDEYQNLHVPLLISYIDFLKFRWSRYVVDFTQRDQKTVYKKFNKGIKTSGINLRRLINKDVKRYKNVLAILLFLLFGFFFIKYGKINFKLQNSHDNRASSIYIETMRIFEKYGIQRRKYFTQDEFLENIETNNEYLLLLLTDFTKIYQKIRFGDDNSTESLNNLEVISKKIKTELSYNQKRNHYIRDNSE